MQQLFNIWIDGIEQMHRVEFGHRVVKGISTHNSCQHAAPMQVDTANHQPTRLNNMTNPKERLQGTANLTIFAKSSFANVVLGTHL